MLKKFMLCCSALLFSLNAYAITAEGETSDDSVKMSDDEQMMASEPASPESSSTPEPMQDTTPKQLMTPTAAQLLSLLEKGYKNQHQTLRLQDEEGEFLALMAKERRGKPKGAVLILHAKGQHAGWPDNLIALHEELANSGWNSLFISLPPPLDKAIPKRELIWPVSQPKPAPEPEDETKDKPESETGDEELKAAPSDDINQPVTDTDDDGGANTASEPPTATMADTATMKPAMGANMEKKPLSRAEQEANYQQQVQTRVQAGVSYLQQQGQFNLALVGEGSGAIYASIYVENMPKSAEKNSFDAIQALVLINADNQNKGLDSSLGELLGAQEIRTLDLVTANQQRSLQRAKKRINSVASLDRGKRYFQVKLPPVKSLQSGHTGPASQRIARRVRGWLDKHMQGQEINAKKER